MDFLKELENKPTVATITKRKNSAHLNKTSLTSDAGLQGKQAGALTRTKIYFLGKTMQQWADELGISSNLAYNRMRMHGDPRIVGNRVSKFEKYFGKTLTEWSKELDISAETVKYRIKKHGDPSLTNRQKCFGKTVRQWSEELGVCTDVVRKRIKKHGDPRLKKDLITYNYTGQTVRELCEQLKVSKTLIS